MVKKHKALFIRELHVALVGCCIIEETNLFEKHLIHFRVCFASHSGLFSCNSTPHRVPYLIAVLTVVSKISHYKRFPFLMLYQSPFSQSSTAICDIGPSARGRMSKCCCLYFYVKLQILL